MKSIDERKNKVNSPFKLLLATIQAVALEDDKVQRIKLAMTALSYLKEHEREQLQVKEVAF